MATEKIAPAEVDSEFEDISLGEIAESDDLTTHDEQIPEWKTRSGKPAVIRLRTLPAGRALEFTERLKGPGAKEAMLQIVQLCAINFDGSPKFPDDKSMALLRTKALPVLIRLQKRALLLNGLLNEKQAEALAKND